MGRRAMTVGLAAALLAFVVLTLTDAGRSPTPPFPRDRVERATLRDPGVAHLLEGRRWSRILVAPLDRTHWRVTIQDGPRSLLDASLGPRGRVEDVALHLPGAHPPGSRQTWSLPVLLLLTAVFCVATAVTPLRSIRNIDVAVFALGLLASLVLYDDRLVRAHVLTGTAVLLYVVSRAAIIGLRPAEPRGAAETPAWCALTSRLSPPRRRRWLAAITAVLAAVGVVTTYTSTGLSDVAFAGLAGATALTHGVLPYGHVTTEVVHGDTYPLLTYVLYLPFAVVSPVDDSFDDMQGSLDLNALALVLVAALLYRTGRRIGSSQSGLLLAAAWLAFPAVELAASGGGNDVPATVFVAAGLALWTRPLWAALLFSVAAWVKIVPGVALVGRVPALRGAALVRAVAVVVAVSAAVVLVLFGLGGSEGPSHMVDALRFQTERGSFHSAWTQLDAPALQHAFQAAAIGLLVTTAFAFATRRELSSDLPRAAALLAADVLLIQLAGNYWTPAYLPWAMPLILVGLFLAPTPAATSSSPGGPQRSPRRERLSP